MPRPRIAAVLVSGLVGAAALLAPAPAANAYSATISFDDAAAPCSFGDTQPLRDEYADQGISFRGSTDTGGGAILDQCGNFGVGARSGTQFLAFNSTSTTANGGVPMTPEKILLNERRTSAKIFVSAGSAGAGAFKLVAKRGGEVVATSEVTTSTSDYVRLKISNQDGFTKLVLKGTTDAGYWVADDLTIAS